MRAGSLIEAFEKITDVVSSLYTPIEFVRNPDAELVRNKFWNKIAKVVGPLLTDDPRATEIQDEIIRNCYVNTPLSDQTDSNIDALLRDVPTSQLVDANVRDLKPGMLGKTAFDRGIEGDIKANRPGTYLLTGGVGSGKTTFIRRFERVVAASFVKEWCIWLHVDYLPLGNIEEEQIDQELRQHTYQEIKRLLQEKYPDIWPSDGETLREVFAPQIEEAKLTLLYGLDPKSEAWSMQVNALTHKLFLDPQTLVESILTHRARTGRRVVVVLDNTDQLGEKFQEAVFLLSQRLSQTCSALTIVALREEKFFAAYRRGIFDAYGDRRFHIGSPNLEDVVRKRLDYAIKKYSMIANATVVAPEEMEEVAEVKQVIRALINSATSRNQNIIRLLACVSNGDMRYALGMFREFISSGNTNIVKILDIIRRNGSYTVAFHEFAKSAILGSRRYYRNNISHIINLFVRSSAPGASHLTGLRLLARLANATGAPSVHGEGFVDTSQLLGEIRQSFGRADDFLARGDELLARALIESEPPRASDVLKSDAVRISASGMYYYRYLVRAFAYVDLVFVDTAILDKEIAVRLAGLAQALPEDYGARFERVRRFLSYMQSEEQYELDSAASRGGPYDDPLFPAIFKQIEIEIALIKEKKGLDDLENR